AGFEYNCLEWSNTGTGNINIAPDFVGINDYHLLAYSRCIDAGTNDLSGLLPSEDIEGNLRLIDGNNNQQAIIDMGVYEMPLSPTPVFGLSEQHFDIEYQINDPLPPIQSFEIRNRGSNIMQWQIYEDCDWLSVTPQSGTSTGELTRVNLSLDPSNLEVGWYQGELIIQDPNAFNSPQKVSVNLHVYIEGQRHVPREYVTIQKGIDAADENDMVVVAPGVYQENISMGGKNIVLTSNNPKDSSMVTQTVIQGIGSASVVTFTGSETADCTLTGFTITGGHTDTYGGGIFGNGALATI
ncbi:MAG: hypothetical protein GY869_20315, partial [Planctomycetes bacterium]|nr:hypothetical protein [Planctomycetota bacterium]